ncbi:MAG: hypothetical protein ACM3SV_10840 [Betaproteobacteria bacterium]
MRHARLVFPLLAVLFLGACVNDRTAHETEANQAITLIREQPRFWDKTVELSLIIARMPDCMRRHALGNGTAKSEVELWQYRPDTFILKIDGRLVAVETRTCEGLEKLDAPPANGLGTLLGTFHEAGGDMVFDPVLEPNPKAR